MKINAWLQFWRFMKWRFWSQDFRKWWYPNGWFLILIHGKPWKTPSKLDDDWGYPDLRKPPNECLCLSTGPWWSFESNEIYRSPSGAPWSFNFSQFWKVWGMTHRNKSFRSSPIPCQSRCIWHPWHDPCWKGPLVNGCSPFLSRG